MRAPTVTPLLALTLFACGRASPPPAKTALATAPAASADAAPKPELPSFTVRDADAMLQAEWARAGVVPSGRADDARWLRRATIDIAGTIPTPEAVLAFEADPAPDKRAKMIDTLVASPAYADHWTAYWDDELLGRQARGQDLDRAAFRRWLHARFAENAPWDRVVTALVTATGVNSAGGPRKGSAPGVEVEEPEGPEVNGAVNWSLRYAQAPQDLAGAASKTFLGVQIQCAQCHDHKTERWTQKDFWSFAAAFARTRPQPLEERAMGKIRRVELVDLDRPAPRFAKDADLAPLAKLKPAALDGTDLGASKNARQAMAAWMTTKDNPYFARAFVNRMWGHFLGRGFTDPVDDMRASNPPAMEPLLAKLAEDFALHGYDVKRLVRTIALTEAYQIEPGAPSESDPENKMWGRFHLTPMGPEELLNGILQATHLEGAMKRAGMAGAAKLRTQLVRQYTFLFDVDEDADSPSYDGTVSQALALLNGSLVGIGSSDIPGNAIGEIVGQPGTDAQKIETLYLRTLSRRPKADETDAWVQYIANAQAPLATAAGPRRGDPLGRLGRRVTADPTRAAYEDVMWTLLNSSEFLFNH
jgi:hypothetical protein